jgi:hypothetical protein
MTDYIVYYLHGVSNLFKPADRLHHLNCYTLFNSRYLITVSRTLRQVWSCRRWGHRVQSYAVWHCVSYQSFGEGGNLLPNCVLSSKSCSVNLVDIYEPSALTNSVTNFCPLRMSTKSIISNCYCSERTWLPAAPMILVQPNSVAIRWVRQATPTGTTLKICALTCVPTFVS